MYTKQFIRNLALFTMVILILVFIAIFAPSPWLYVQAAQTTTLDETCPAFVSEALTRLNTTCQNLGRNSLCYGHDLVSVEFTQEAAAQRFRQPTDQTELVNVSSIITAPLDEILGQWGLALMNVQANVPGTLPGQGVVFILMGNAEMQNKVAADTANMSPMQAFQFTGGIGTPGCKSAQGSLIIQGPNNVIVDLEANGAKIRLASTILLTQRDNQFSVTTLSGAAKVDDVIIPAGFTTTTELDDDNTVIEFTDAEPVDEDDEIFDLYEEIADDTLHYEIDFTEFEDEWDEAYTEYEENDGEFEDVFPCLTDPDSDECAIELEETDDSIDDSTDDSSDNSSSDDGSSDDGSSDDGSSDDGSSDDGSSDDGSSDDGSSDDGSSDDGSSDDGSSDDGGDTGGGGDDGGGDDDGGDRGDDDDSGGEGEQP